MHIRRSTAFTVGVASILAVSALGPVANATTVPPGTDGGGGGGGDCVVGVSWNNFQEPRWAAWDEPHIKDALEAGGASYISTDAGSSAEQQATDVENLIAQGANVLIILAQDGTAILPSVATALSSGIPVIAYDRLIDDPGVLYLTFDNVGVGRTIAEVIYDLVPTGNYVIIKGNSADANADFLRAGMEEVIGDAVAAGDITIVGETYTDNWDPALAQTEMEQFLTANDNDVQAVLSENISPAAIGNNSLGSNDGHGYDVNPATGEPYAPNVVLRANYARTLAEFWADGPKSETPPGHWNVIANDVTDSPGLERRIGGTGAIVDPLEWDVKLYLALNGAVHDAAIAAWGLKGYYDSARPISMVRYMGGLGQSSDPNGPSYDPEGLPLEAGLIEVVTEESSAPGERHEALADHVGEIAVRTWRGFPADPETETSGVGWILAVDWVPYQRATFVTPAFPGYVSGHSTFSRAAAEVMAAFTGDAYFPGGMSEYTLPRSELLHEEGPTEDTTLQWATYFDAADQAGVSRIYMGIHITADDFNGRQIGSACGEEAWVLAQRYFDGTAT